jgi:hypothetical protein
MFHGITAFLHELEPVIDWFSRIRTEIGKWSCRPEENNISFGLFGFVENFNGLFDPKAKIRALNSYSPISISYLLRPAVAPTRGTVRSCDTLAICEKPCNLRGKRGAHLKGPLLRFPRFGAAVRHSAYLGVIRPEIPRDSDH